jgi:hypothetical protein
LASSADGDLEAGSADGDAEAGSADGYAEAGALAGSADGDTAAEDDRVECNRYASFWPFFTACKYGSNVVNTFSPCDVWKFLYRLLVVV